MGEPLPVDLIGALTNFLGSYTERHEDVLVLEAISNAIDAKAKKVHITLSKEPGRFYIKFANDGPGMSKNEFLSYHTISYSTKEKGEGIGFAGVGAKIYLASRDGSEILTVTGTLGNIFASKMYRIGRRVEYDTSLKIPLVQIVGSTTKIKAFVGTWYEVNLTENEYYYFRNNLTTILQKWFSYAIMHDSPKIFINNKRIEPFRLGKPVKRVMNYKQNKITCYFYYDSEVPQENKHLVYTVFGKRIINEPVDFDHQIIEVQRNKLFGIVDVSVLAKYLVTNKEGFQKNSEVNTAKSKTRQALYDFLTEKGFIKHSQQQVQKADIFTNEFARRLDKLLQHKQFKFLNPFNDPRVRTVVLQTDGNVAVSQVDTGQEVIFKTKQRTHNPTGGGIWDTIGDESEKNGFVRDDEGTQLGKDVETKAKRLLISKLPFPNDPREGWIDYGLGVVVYNLAHPFAKNPEVQSGIAGYYNMARVVISTLIKEGNEKQPMDAKKGLQIFEELYHDMLQSTTATE